MKVVKIDTILPVAIATTEKDEFQDYLLKVNRVLRSRGVKRYSASEFARQAIKEKMEREPLDE